MRVGSYTELFTGSLVTYHSDAIQSFLDSVGKTFFNQRLYVFVNVLARFTEVNA